MQQLPICYVPVSVKERLPEKHDMLVPVILEDMGAEEGKPFFQMAIFNPLDGGLYMYYRKIYLMK